MKINKKLKILIVVALVLLVLYLNPLAIIGFVSSGSGTTSSGVSGVVPGGTIAYSWSPQIDNSRLPNYGAGYVMYPAKITVCVVKPSGVAVKCDEIKAGIARYDNGNPSIIVPSSEKTDFVYTVPTTERFSTGWSIRDTVVVKTCPISSVSAWNWCSTGREYDVTDTKKWFFFNVLDPAPGKECNWGQANWCENNNVMACTSSGTKVIYQVCGSLKCKVINGPAICTEDCVAGQIQCINEFSYKSCVVSSTGATYYQTVSLQEATYDKEKVCINNQIVWRDKQTKTCADGSRVPYTAYCMKTCPDGKRYPETQECPVVVSPTVPSGTTQTSGSMGSATICTPGTTRCNGEAVFQICSTDGRYWESVSVSLYGPKVICENGRLYKYCTATTKVFIGDECPASTVNLSQTSTPSSPQPTTPPLYLSNVSQNVSGNDSNASSIFPFPILPDSTPNESIGEVLLQTFGIQGMAPPDQRRCNNNNVCEVNLGETSMHCQDCSGGHVNIAIMIGLIFIGAITYIVYVRWKNA